MFNDQLVSAHRCSPFVTGLISAALATIGLVTNSSTTVLGAMLFSPIGSIITKRVLYVTLTNNDVELNLSEENKKKTALSKWVRTLITIAALTVATGALIGYIMWGIYHFVEVTLGAENSPDVFGASTVLNLPTVEMIGRATPIDSIAMVFVACLCGLGLPISIVLGNGTQVVAIGIATALIPPLANIGLSLPTLHQRDWEDSDNYCSRAVVGGTMLFLINFVGLFYFAKVGAQTVSSKNNRLLRIEKWLAGGEASVRESFTKPYEDRLATPGAWHAPTTTWSAKNPIYQERGN
jgi:uncharacterized membrane protein